MASIVQVGQEQMSNPYVGPRTFRTKEWELFFGRDREARDLLSLIISERLVLFYAPSGAGKSSLLNTKVIYGLTEEGFEVLPVGRVGGASALEIKADNIFIYNLITYLHEREEISDDFRSISLARFLDNLVWEEGEQHYYDDKHDYAKDEELKPRVLIIDQFEEILMTNTTHWQQRKGFFQQLSEALTKDDQLWVVLSIREDYVAGLEPYLHHLPDGLRNRYYMQRLKKNAAKEAIVEPAKNAGRPFEEEAAELLVKNLRRIRLEETAEDVRFSEFVEPVQLQAVCFQMWNRLQADRPGETITVEDVELIGDVDKALIEFFDEAVAETAKANRVSEGKLRSWVENELFTPAGTRNMVYRGKDTTEGLSTPVVDGLRDRFVLRTVVRPGGDFYELSHGRLVDPIRQSNSIWREQRRARRRRIAVPVAGFVALVATIFALFAILISVESRERPIQDGSHEHGFVVPLLSDRWDFRAKRDHVVIVHIDADDSSLEPFWTLSPAGRRDQFRPFDRFLNRIENLLTQNDEIGFSSGSAAGERIRPYYVDAADRGESELAYLLTGDGRYVIDAAGLGLSFGPYQLSVELIPLEELEYSSIVRDACMERTGGREAEPDNRTIGVCGQAVKLSVKEGDLGSSYALCRRLNGMGLLDVAVPACAHVEEMAAEIEPGEPMAVFAGRSASVSSLLKFDAAAGQIVIISHNAEESFRPYLYLLGSDLLHDDRPSPISGGEMDVNEKIVAIIPGDGIYWIDARDRGDTGGGFEVSLEMATRDDVLGQDAEARFVREVCLAYVSDRVTRDNFREEVCQKAVELTIPEGDVHASYQLCTALNSIDLGNVAAPACDHVEALAGEIQPGETTSVVVDSDRPSLLQFEAEAGQIMIIANNADESLGAYLVLHDPEFLRGEGPVGPGRPTTARDRNARVVAEVPESGRYLIATGYRGGNSGIYDVSLEVTARDELLAGDVDPNVMSDVCLHYSPSEESDDTLREQVCQQAVELTLAERDLVSSQRLCLALKTEEICQQAYELVLEQGDFDSIFRLCGGRGDMDLREEPVQACEHLMAMTDRIQSGESRRVEVQPGSPSLLMFEAEEGQLATISLSPDVMLSPYVNLFGPGLLRGRKPIPIVSVNMDVRDSTATLLPEDGFYLIETGDQSNSSGAIVVSLELESLNAAPLRGQPPQECDLSPTFLSYGPVDVGTIVVLGRHRPVNDDENWEEEMEQYLWEEATVLAMDGIDRQGCPVVRVDIDEGRHQWRVRDFQLPEN